MPNATVHPNDLVTTNCNSREDVFPMSISRPDAQLRLLQFVECTPYGCRAPAVRLSIALGEVSRISRTLSGEISLLPGPVHVCADRSSEPHPYQAVSRPLGRSGGESGTNQLAASDRQVEAHRVSEETAHSQRDSGLLPGRRPLPGDLVTRWHESSGERLQRRDMTNAEF